jgi:SagB-type dehydrogenase family enzyme
VPQKITLPEPRSKGSLSIEETLLRRRSHRTFEPTPLSQAELSQLLWSAQGLTHKYGLRTAPSAGGLFPLEVYAVTEGALYLYEPEDHSLEVHVEGDRRPELFAWSLEQEMILEAPLTIVIAAVYARIERKYGAHRTPRYVHMEVGHAAQNMLLQAVSLGLGAVVIGAFDDEGVKDVLNLPQDHEPLYLIPIGYPR